jgi:hemin uptake protein HemP
MKPRRASTAVVQTNAVAPDRPVRLESHILLGDAREVEIVHGTQCYRLRVTALGKLILTK